MRRIPLPGWIFFISALIFITAWISAPKDLLSRPIPGQSFAPSARPPAGLTPIEQLRPLPLTSRPRTARSRGRRTDYGFRVAFTFDDGPHPVHTTRLLRLLKEYKVPATFFINGYWTERYPGVRRVLKAITDQGHRIGNHSYHHAMLHEIPPEQQTREILHNQRLIEEITGGGLRLFRPAYGSMTDHARDVLFQHGFTEVRWDATAADEELRDPAAIRDEVMYWLYAHQGGIVMLHDRYKWSVDAAELLLSHLRSLNPSRLRRNKPAFEVVSLDSLLGLPQNQ